MSGYHPQANWQVERTNQSLEDALRCSGPEPICLEHLPAVGEVRSQLFGLGVHRTVLLHGVTGVPALVVQGPGRRGGSALGTGQHMPMEEAVEVGPRCTPAGLPVLTMAGQSAPDSSPHRSPERLAGHKGPPAPGGILEVGSTLRWPLRGRGGGEPRSRLPEAPPSIQGTPNIQRVQGQASC